MYAIRNARFRAMSIAIVNRTQPILNALLLSVALCPNSAGVDAVA
jgi:hypothetical protein